MKKWWKMGIAMSAIALIALIGPVVASASFRASEPGLMLTGSEQTTTVLTVQGQSLTCQSGPLGETQGEVYANQELTLGGIDCELGWQDFATDSAGCSLRLSSYQVATLHSCEAGGIEMSWKASGSLGHCVIFIPNQTFPVAYANGPENSYLALDVETGLRAAVTEAKGPACSYFSVTESTVANLGAEYKVSAEWGDFWFDASEMPAGEFHTAPSSAIEGTLAGGSSTFKINSETVECEIGDVAGEFPESASSEALGDLALGPATGACASSYWSEGVTIDATGCRYSFHADGTADLESCGNGGILVSEEIPNIVDCEIFIPNQSGSSGVTYENESANGTLRVRAAMSLGLAGEVVKAGWFCPYNKGQEVSVTQEGVTDFLSDEGSEELWFG